MDVLSIILSILIGAVMLAVNVVYFGKRKHMFSDITAEKAAGPPFSTESEEGRCTVSIAGSACRKTRGSAPPRRSAAGRDGPGYGAAANAPYSRRPKSQAILTACATTPTGHACSCEIGMMWYIGLIAYLGFTGLMGLTALAIGIQGLDSYDVTFAVLTMLCGTGLGAVSVLGIYDNMNFKSACFRWCWPISASSCWNACLA